jgi:nitrite reductase (NO-forming)
MTSMRVTRRGTCAAAGLGAALLLGACGGPPSGSPAPGGQSPAQPAGGSTTPLSTRNMPALAGQAQTCAGPHAKTFDLTVTENTDVDLGLGITFTAWTYAGRLPGPTLEVCEGDAVTIRVHNQGTTSHGLDTHAFQVDARKYGPVPPGQILTLQGTVKTPGVFMYHCSAGPVTDLHIKSGLHGAMIVYPREPLRPARELAVVEDAVYGAYDAHGHIPGTDPAKTAKNDELFSMFNGRLDNGPIHVNVGDLVRLYVVNVGPYPSSVHVIGSLLDRVYAGTPPVAGVQTYAVPAGSGAIIEFYIPEAGEFSLVDHDKLQYLPFGLSLLFTTGPPGS